MVPPSGSNDPPNPIRLSALEAEVKAHWLEHRPQMCMGLQAKDLLDQSVRQAVQQTKEALAHLVLEKGVPYPHAWHLLREEWMYLLGEEDQAVLGESPGIDASAVRQAVPRTSGSGQIDQETYRKALPHFIAVANHFQQAGRPLAEFVTEVYARFGVTTRPYLISSNFSSTLQQGMSTSIRPQQRDGRLRYRLGQKQPYRASHRPTPAPISLREAPVTGKRMSSLVCWRRSVS